MHSIPTFKYKLSKRRKFLCEVEIATIQAELPTIESTDQFLMGDVFMKMKLTNNLHE